MAKSREILVRLTRFDRLTGRFLALDGHVHSFMKRDGHVKKLFDHRCLLFNINFMVNPDKWFEIEQKQYYNAFQ